MKISPLSVLLATTFLSTNAFALTADDLGTSENVKWKEVFSSTDDTVVVETPEGAKYFQYTYTTPAGRTVYNEGIENVTGNIDADFIGINGGRSQGNAIYTGGNITSVTGDFINNSASLFAARGFIFNSDNIQNIKGDFISNIVYGNYSVNGVGITNEGFINNIEGDFIGNRANIDRYTQSNAVYGYSTYGGAIFNGGNINNIAGNFIGNSIYLDNYSSQGYYVSSYGGAIANGYGTIETITGDAIGNYIQTNGYGYGGFLDNAAYNPNVRPSSLNFTTMANNSFYNIGSINGNIISNHVLAFSSAYGGAISNRDFGSIAEINSDSISYNYAVYDSSFNEAPVSLEPMDYNPFSDYYGGAAYGGAIYNEGSIGNITASISNNYAGAQGAAGGAIFNEGSISSINANISSNYAISAYYAEGGAITNTTANSGAYIGDITGNITGNYVYSGEEARGGFIANSTVFISNMSDDLYYSQVGNITGDITGNYAKGGWVAEGGAIYNYDAIIGDITGNFSNNRAIAIDGQAFGGAIYNRYGEIGDLAGDFIGNYASGYWDAHGGAIINDGTIGDITGDFIGNYAEGNGSWGGAITTWGNMGNITGDFISNHVKGDYAGGGAINQAGDTTGNITGDFIGNYAEGRYMALGGAIFAIGNTEYVYDDGSSDTYEVGNITGSFINNYVKVSDSSGIALGGAIFVDGGELTFKADGITNRFSGNYVEDSSGITNNAIWVNNYDGDGSSVLNFEVTNGGGYVFDDEIDGGFYDWDDTAPVQDGYAYNINIYGDVCPQCIVNSVIFNNKVKNVYNLTLDTTQMVLGKNAHIEIVNDYIAISGEKYTPYLRLNVDAVNREVGQLEIGGQVEGTTQVIANIISYKDIRGEESIVFATAPNDTTGGEDSFKVFRTVGSPYKWYVDYNETAKTWGLAMGEETNDYEEDCYPSDEKPEDKPAKPNIKLEVEPEIIASTALPSAAVAQTSGMIYNVMRKVNMNRLYCPGCGFYDYNWNGQPLHNLWVDTFYNGLKIDAPVEIDADVWGIEAGGDVQHDINNKLGIFVSYRQGGYEMDGKGDKYYSKIGSELDIDSYLAGLYYRYDHNNWYIFATLYGGMQEADVRTDDGVSTDTSGLELGGSAEFGYSFAVNDTLSLTPSLGVFYTQVDFDDASDDYGKTVEYNTLQQIELEAGIKLNKAIYTDNGVATVYAKPSVVQTFVDGDEVSITGLGKVDTIEDDTLGRIEIGGSYGFDNNWSAYGWANYTFGSDYEATSIGAGVNYAW